jgi:actin related protein 2/3 complex subunit 5
MQKIVPLKIETNRHMSYVDELADRGKTAAEKVKTNAGEALKLVLDELPVRPTKVGPAPDRKDKAGQEAFKEAVEAARKQATVNVCQTLVSIEGPKIAPAIKSLSDEERDTLMKYIYKGFAERKTVTDEKTGVEKSVPVYDSNALLKAHDEVSKISGTGPIIRSIHTRLEV